MRRRFGGHAFVVDARDVRISGRATLLAPTVGIAGFLLSAFGRVSKDDPNRHLLLKNIYELTLQREGDRFVIVSMIIRTIWFDGDPAVLFVPAAPA